MVASTTAASIVMILGLAVTYILLPDGGSVAIYRTAAIGAALAIGLGLFLETRDVRSVVRTDFLIIAALFALTLLEFFFPQDAVEKMISAQSATRGVEALFLGFIGLIVGRSLVSQRRTVRRTNTMAVHWSATTLFRVYVLLFVVGFSHVFWSVGFDPVELINQMLRPRFSQPWSRGRLGGWTELWGELAKLAIYMVPAFAGAVLAKPFRFTLSQKIIVTSGLLLTLFFGFSSGTRNIFCIYILIFVVSYILLKPNISWKRLAAISCIAAVLLLASSYYMLQFRTVGLEGYIENSSSHKHGYRQETLFIDNNLPVISRLTEVFPDRADYLGWEQVSFALFRPVPRALWPSKPEKVSISAEDALGERGLTLSSTFVGEAYMMGGYLGVVGMGVLLGWLAGWWNRFGASLHSNAHVILYASGFFAAALSMRSTVWLTTAMLPTLAIWLYLKYGGRRRRNSCCEACRVLKVQLSAPPRRLPV